MIICTICDYSTISPQCFKKHLKNKHNDILKNDLLIEEFYIKEIYKIDSLILEKFKNDYVDKKTTLRLFCKNNNIRLSTIIKYLKLNNIKIWSSKEMCGLDFVLQNKENTCLERYGIKNIFQDPIVREKGQSSIDRVSNYLHLKDVLQKKYGVDNWSQIPGVSEKMSLSQKNRCGKMSYDEKLKMTEKARMSLNFTSKLELRIQDVLNDLNVPYTANGFLYRYNFDFIFKNRIVLEIQGDFWHANPLYYKEDDILLKGWMVKDVWKKDNIKRKKLIDNNWKIYYLWETDINKMSYDDIKKYLINILGIDNGK